MYRLTVSGYDGSPCNERNVKKKRRHEKMQKLIESLKIEIEQRMPRETVILSCNCLDGQHDGCITVIDGNY